VPLKPSPAKTVASHRSPGQIHKKSPTLLTAAERRGQHDGMSPSERPEESELLKELGITPSFADERQAPPVDRQKLLRFRRGELDENSSLEVRDCLATFRSWYAAYLELLDEPLAEGGDQG